MKFPFIGGPLSGIIREVPNPPAVIMIDLETNEIVPYDKTMEAIGPIYELASVSLGKDCTACAPAYMHEPDVVILKESKGIK